MESIGTGSVDITGLNFHQLEELRTRAEHRITEMRETGAPAFREKWGEQAAAIGCRLRRSWKAASRNAAAAATATPSERRQGSLLCGYGAGFGPYFLRRQPPPWPVFVFAGVHLDVR